MVMDGIFRVKRRTPLVDLGFSFSCVFRFFAFQLQLFATLLHLIGLLVQIHFAEPVNSNVVQDKTNYDAFLNNLF